ncbi:uncharacterized protein LOC143300442 isoform X1 [Babylonia areolata]|uniref:uncharacterized protein LOC143300442 isoform X1 n=1 Tax=Babylonia areolata TaxID=304850 RepID=UPI003FD020F3
MSSAKTPGKSVLTLDQRRDYANDFVRLDSNGDGWLSRGEFADWAMGLAGLNVTDKQLECSDMTAGHLPTGGHQRGWEDNSGRILQGSGTCSSTPHKEHRSRRDLQHDGQEPGRLPVSGRTAGRTPRVWLQPHAERGGEVRRQPRQRPGREDLYGGILGSF